MLCIGLEDSQLCVPPCARQLSERSASSIPQRSVRSERSSRWPTFFSTDADNPSPRGGSILEHYWCLLRSDGSGLILGIGVGSSNTLERHNRQGLHHSEVSC